MTGRWWGEGGNLGQHPRRAVLACCVHPVVALAAGPAHWDNWIKDRTTEQYQLIYEQPIYPKAPEPVSGGCPEQGVAFISHFLARNRTLRQTKTTLSGS